MNGKKVSEWLQVFIGAVQILGFFFVAAAVAKAGITVDGSDSDWSGTLPSALHGTAVSAGEWVYRGAAGDMRTDPPAFVRPNYDLTEVRFTSDGERLFVLVRLADVTATDEVHVNLAIDTDGDPHDTELKFIGDESGLWVDAATPENHVEFNISVHNTTPGVTQIELYDDNAGNGLLWFAPPGGQQSFISAANDLVEFALPLADLGLNGLSRFRVTLATFDNNDDHLGVGYNNDKDTTVDYPSNDALDIMGGTPGQSANAWDRDLSDNKVSFFYEIDLALIGGLLAAPTPRCACAITPRPNDADGDGLPDATEYHPNVQPLSGSTSRFLWDTDGDGLSDGYEIARGGAPSLQGIALRLRADNRDSDGDRVPDGVEVMILGTDPTVPNNTLTDVDQDGLPDSVDPNDNAADTDGDGVSDSYEAAACGLPAASNAARRSYLGDINCDGFSTNLDALVAQSLLLGLSPYANFPGANNGDVNRDGFVSNFDALAISARFLNLLPSLPLPAR